MYKSTFWPDQYIPLHGHPKRIMHRSIQYFHSPGISNNRTVVMHTPSPPSWQIKHLCTQDQAFGSL